MLGEQCRQCLHVWIANDSTTINHRRNYSYEGTRIHWTCHVVWKMCEYYEWLWALRTPLRHHEHFWTPMGALKLWDWPIITVITRKWSLHKLKGWANFDESLIFMGIINEQFIPIIHWLMGIINEQFIPIIHWTNKLHSIKHAMHMWLTTVKTMC